MSMPPRMSPQALALSVVLPAGDAARQRNRGKVPPNCQSVNTPSGRTPAAEKGGGEAARHLEDTLLCHCTRHAHVPCNGAATPTGGQVGHCGQHHSHHTRRRAGSRASCQAARRAGCCCCCWPAPCTTSCLQTVQRQRCDIGLVLQPQLRAHQQEALLARPHCNSVAHRGAHRCRTHACPVTPSEWTCMYSITAPSCVRPGLAGATAGDATDKATATFARNCSSSTPPFQDRDRGMYLAAETGVAYSTSTQQGATWVRLALLAYQKAKKRKKRSATWCCAQTMSWERGPGATGAGGSAHHIHSVNSHIDSRAVTTGVPPAGGGNASWCRNVTGTLRAFLSRPQNGPQAHPQAKLDASTHVHSTAQLCRTAQHSSRCLG